MLLFTARPRIMHGAGLRAAGRPPFRRAHGLRPCRRRSAPPGLRPRPDLQPPAPTRQKPDGHKNRLQGAGTGPQTKPSCGRFRRAPPAAAMLRIAGPAARPRPPGRPGGTFILQTSGRSARPATAAGTQPRPVPSGRPAPAGRHPPPRPPARIDNPAGCPPETPSP